MTATDLLVSWSIALGVGVLAYARRQATVFHPLTPYLLLHLALFCLRPTLIASGWFGEVALLGVSPPDPEAVRMACWVSSAGLVLFAAGCLLGSLRAPGLRDPVSPPWDSSATRALACIAAACGAATLGVFLASESTSGALQNPLHLLMLPALALVALRAGWRWWSLLALVAASVWWSGYSTLPWTPVGAALFVVLLWLWTHQRRHPPWLLTAMIGAGCAGALVLDSPVELRFWRGASEAPQVTSASKPGHVHPLNQPALAHFDGLVHAIGAVPARREFTAGRHHLDRLARSSGPGARANLVAAGGDSARGLPVALVADAWISGGWVGVGLVFLVVGLGLGLAFGFFSRRQDSPAAAVGFAVVQAAAVSLLLTGDSLVLVLLAVGLVPVVLWHGLARRFQRSELAATQREHLREERERRRLLGTALLHPHAAALSAAAVHGEGSARPESDRDDLEPTGAASPAAPGGSVDAAPPDPVPDTQRPPPPRWHDREG